MCRSSIHELALSLVSVQEEILTTPEGIGLFNDKTQHEIQIKRKSKHKLILSSSWIDPSLKFYWSYTSKFH